MKVLVACEESQAVCIAFREKGYEAYSCDLQKCSGEHPEWHICGDALKLLSTDVDFQTQDKILHHIDKWDLLIAHPPCTYLSNAGARWLKPKGVLNQARYEQGMKAKEFFMRFYDADITHICVENPLPSKIFGLPQHSQIIQPYEYGHPVSKRTLLWLKNLPKLQPTNIVDKTGEWNVIHRSPKQRSKTFPGIAAAMADQWGSYIDKSKKE